MSNTSVSANPMLRTVTTSRWAAIQNHNRIALPRKLSKYRDGVQADQLFKRAGFVVGLVSQTTGNFGDRSADRLCLLRQARLCSSGTFQHLIFRLLDKQYRQYRFVDDEDRATYLRLLGEDALATTWRFASYALLSNHGHFGALVGVESLSKVFPRP